MTTSFSKFDRTGNSANEIDEEKEGNENGCETSSSKIIIVLVQFDYICLLKLFLAIQF